MAEPLAPEGYIRIKDAYDTFIFGALGEPPSLDNLYGAVHSAFANRIDTENRVFVSALGQIAYGGKVVSHDGKLFEISGDMFTRTKLADLLPLHNAIPSGISGPLANYAGGIICLKMQTFFEWLQQHLSSHLHGEIQNEDLEPIQANERLAAINLPALDAMPPLSDYYEAVKQEPYWTLPMVVAWIAWRNLNSVVKQYWPYAKQGGHWLFNHGPNQTKSGMVWESADMPLLISLMSSETDESYGDNPPLFFIKESREQLWRKLLAGELTAIGVEGQGSHKKIASERWASLQISTTLKGDEFVSAGPFYDAEKIYDVKLLSNDVLRIWPSLDTNNIGTPNTTSLPNVAVSKLPTLTENDIERLYIERRDSWPSAEKYPSRDDDIAWAKSISGQVTNKMARDLRAKLAPEAWTSQGRRRKLAK